MAPLIWAPEGLLTLVDNALLSTRFADSALACFRMGMSGSGLAMRVQGRLGREADAAQEVIEAWVGAQGAPDRILVSMSRRVCKV